MFKSTLPCVKRDLTLLYQRSAQGNPTLALTLGRWGSLDLTKTLPGKRYYKGAGTLSEKSLFQGFMCAGP